MYIVIAKQLSLKQRDQTHDEDSMPVESEMPDSKSSKGQDEADEGKEARKKKSRGRKRRQSPPESSLTKLSPAATTPAPKATPSSRRKKTKRAVVSSASSSEDEQLQHAFPSRSSEEREGSLSTAAQPDSSSSSECPRWQEYQLLPARSRRPPRHRSDLSLQQQLGPPPATTGQGGPALCCWNERQVAAWLVSLRSDYLPYARLFLDRHISGQSLLRLLKDPEHKQYFSWVVPDALHEVQIQEAAVLRQMHDGPAAHPFPHCANTPLTPSQSQHYPLQGGLAQDKIKF